MPRAGSAGRHFAYLLRCADGTYYAGYTVDPLRRLAAHRFGDAARYTRGRGPLVLAAVWRCPTRRAALRLERLLKRLSHAAKRRLASGESLGRVVARRRRARDQAPGDVLEWMGRSVRLAVPTPQEAWEEPGCHSTDRSRSMRSGGSPRS